MLSELFIHEHEPLFLNEGTSQSELELQKLEAIAPLVSDDDTERIRRDIRLHRAGVAGEKRIVFELSNSHYPLVFIHDLNLDFEGTTAQIDFLVVTPFNTLAIECKNMVGDIQIDGDGAFVRTFGKGKYRKREGIYSPVTQNRRHVETLKAIVRSRRSKTVQFFQQFILDDYYHSVVVLANEKSLLLADDAPEDVKQQVIRADQLIEYIRRLDKQFARKNGRETFGQMRKRAEAWLASNAPSGSDIAGTYQIAKRADDGRPAGADRVAVVATSPQRTSAEQAILPPTCPVCGSPMVLRTARRGKNRGNKFWGCSMYGKTGCRGIVPLEE